VTFLFFSAWQYCANPIKNNRLLIIATLKVDYLLITGQKRNEPGKVPSGD
jgi:hypothetical protein